MKHRAVSLLSLLLLVCLTGVSALRNKCAVQNKCRHDDDRCCDVISNDFEDQLDQLTSVPSPRQRSNDTVV